MDYQTQIDNLIELAIVQRDELKQLVEQLPQLREYLSAEVEKKFEAVEPELRSELEAFFAQKTDERVEDLRGEVSERIAEVLKSLEMAASAKYAALMQEKDRAAEVLNQAEAKIAEVQAAIPGKVKELVTDELSRFPRANQIDQLRKEFAEPRGLNPRGKWQAGERYQKLDLVSYNGESYVSNVDDNTEKPSRSSAAWTLSAARGQGGGGGGITSLNDLIGSPTSDLDIVGAEGSNYVRKTLTAGANVTLTETPTEITISSTGGGGGTSAETLIANVTNAESVAITKGQVVYAFAATGNRVSVKLAYNTSDATSAKTFGVVSSASISAGGTGTVTCVGVIDGLNLGTFADGDSVYLGATPGTFTTTKPYAPNHLVYVGIVERANAGNGELYVRIQNGYELDEIHDVQITTPPAAGSLLMRDATNSLWKANRLTGTANQITVTNADAAVTLSIPTNPTLNGTATMGSINASGKVTATGTTAFPYEGQLIASNSSPSGTNSAVSQAILQAQPGYSTFVGTTGDGTAASYRTGGLGAVILDQQGYLISDAARGLLLHSINGPTIFATQNTGSEKMRLLASGTLLLGTTTDNSLGKIQVSGAITSTETGGTGLFGFFGGSSLVVGTLGSASMVLRTNNTAALTLDTSQNATFAKDILLGTSGPSVPGTLSGRAPRQGLVSDGTGLITATSTNIGTGDFTASAWVNAASYVASVFGFNGAGGIVNCVLDFPSDTLMRVYDGAGPTAYTVTVPTRPVNKWFHATWVRSAGVVTCYLDGVSQGTVTANFDIGAINYIGSISAFNKFTGRLSGLYLYNRALSAAEVKALYETGVPAASDINSASNTSIITGDNSTFASNTGWWTLSGSATISGGSLNLSAGGSFAWRNGLLRSGSRYLVTVNITANTAVDGLAIYSGGAIVAVFTGTGTKTAEFAAGSSAPLGSFYLFQAGAGAITVDSVTLNALGAVLAPDAAQRGSYLTWYDTSGNNSHITLPSSGVTWNVPASPILNLVGTPTTLSSFVNMYVTSLAGGDSTGGRMTWYSSGTGNVETGFLQVTQASGFGGTFSIGLNTTNSGTASTVFQIKKNGNTLLGTTTDSSNGRLQVADHTASTGGIGFGTETSLHRYQAGGLVLDHTNGTAPALMWRETGTSTLRIETNSQVGYISTLTANSLILRTNSVAALTLDSSQNATFAARVMSANGGAVNGSEYAAFVALVGADATLGACGVRVGALPSATAGSRYGFITCGDNSDWRPLYLGGSPGIASNGGQVRVPATLVSNSTSSGALVVSGGLGVAGAAFFGGNIQCNAVFAANNTTLYLRPQGATISAGQLEVATTGNVTINGNLTVTGTISPSSGAGLTNVWIPASQWIPRTTNGCGVDSTETTTNRQNFDELLFDPAAIEYAQALVRMPSNYNNGTVTARFFWSSSSSTGSVVWGLQARAFADDDALDTAFGTAQTVTDTLLATGDMHISAATSAVTSGGTPAATTPIQFQLYRDATNGSDTLGSDARLLGVEISFTSV